MPVVSVTRLRVRSLLFLPAFLLATARIVKEARTAEGNLGVKLLRDRRNAFWTCTCWSSEESMKAFLLEGAHGDVMRKLLTWCDEAALAHWGQESDEMPSWEDAHRSLLRRGRTSKVNHPSPAQKAFRIDPPKSND
jgi:quinol monooxygenase YgiN